MDPRDLPGSTFLLLLFVLVSPLNARAQETPSLFAPGTISTSAHEGPFAFTPDGRTVYFVRYAASMARPGFFISRLEDGRWSDPQPAAMPDGIAPGPLCFSPDARRLFFTHLPDSANRSRLWVADRVGGGWDTPRPVGGALEEWDGDQLSPSVTSDATLYFVSNRNRDSGGWDVYRSVLRDGVYQEPELIGARRFRGVSTVHPETSVTVALDGSFLVFSTVGAPNGLGGSDLYLAALPASERERTRVTNLGRLVNGRGDEIDPRLSADGRRLYFGRSGDIYEVDFEQLRRPATESAAWQTLTTLPVPRNRPRAVAADGRIYVYGGVQQESPGASISRNRVDVFDPAANSWSALPPAPAEFDAADLIAMDDRLFLFRACPGERAGVAEYEAASGQWRVRSEASASARQAGGCRTESRTVLLGRKAFTVFRANGLRPFNAVAEYDLETGAWTPKKSMPEPAWHFAALGGLIYAFGAGEEARRVLAYDPVTDRWTDVALMPMAVWAAAVVPFRDEIWLIGGHGQRSLEPVGGEPTASVVRFDPTRRTWSDGPDLPHPRLLAAALVTRRGLLVLGCTRMGAATPDDQTVLRYAPATETATGRR